MQNPTNAKELVLYFHTIKELEIIPETMAKSMVQMKQLLKKGYTPEQIKSTMEYYKDDMYSIGYLQYVIDKHITEEYMKELKDKELETLTEVSQAGDNRQKAERFNSQSRFGKKYNIDLFKEPE